MINTKIGKIDCKRRVVGLAMGHIRLLKPALLAMRQTPKSKPQPVKCPLCGVPMQLGHESSKKHQANVVLASLISPDLLQGGPTSIQKVREVLHLGKTQTELSPEQKAAVASLVRIDRTGLSKTHFLRTNGYRAVSSGLCTPDQLARAHQHKRNCSVRIQDTGLELSRFHALDIYTDVCTPDEAAKASELVDARFHGDVPIGYLLEELNLAPSVKPRAKPLWVSKRDYEKAEDAYQQYCEGKMTWAEICDVWEHPWDE